MLWHLPAYALLGIVPIVLGEVSRVNDLDVLPLDPVALDDEPSQERSGCLLNQEVLVYFLVRDDFFKPLVEESTVEEVIKVGDDSQGQEVHDDLNMCVVGHKSDVVGGLDGQHHGSLQETRKPSQSHASVLLEFPRVIYCVFHEHAALLELALEEDMEHNTTHEAGNHD